MDKIPVGRTIGHGYGYLFKNFPTIIGIMWFPFAIIIAGAVGLGFLHGGFGKAVMSSDAATIGHLWYLIAPYYLFAFVLVSMQIVGLTDHALGRKAGPVYFYFSLEKPVWRLLGAYLLVFLLMIAFIVVFIVGALLIGMAVAAATGVKPGAPGSAGTTATTGLIVVAIGAVAYCAFIYWAVRQSFLLTPVAVAEERIGIGRAWTLGRGNFWRMLVILIAILGPVLLIEVAIIFGFLMPGLPPTAAQGATPDQIAAWNAAYMQHIKSYWYVLVPAYFLIAAIIYGVYCAAAAFAYRALVPAEKAEDVF